MPKVRKSLFSPTGHFAQNPVSPERPSALWNPCGLVKYGDISSSNFSQSQVRNCSPGLMEQTPSRGHEASPQSRLGVGCMRCSSSKTARAECTCAGAAHRHSSLIPCSGVSSFLSPPRSAMKCGALKCNTGSRLEGRSVSRPHCPSHFRGGTPYILQTAT